MRENGLVMKSMRFILSAFLCAALCIGQAQPPAGPSTPITPQPAERSDRNLPALSLSDLSSSLEVLVNRVRPAVVQIFSTGYAAGEDSEATTASLLTKQHSTGSGVILAENGYIVTNAHVVRGARLIQVRLPSTRRDQPAAKLLEAKLVGMDREIDIAVIRIEKGGLPFLALGD